MTWPEWVSAVLVIAQSRGFDISVSYPTPSYATFSASCRFSPYYVSAGAGADMIHLTTPERFTDLWFCEPVPISPEPWDRRGRYIPRVPAMAVSDALRELFRI